MSVSLTRAINFSTLLQSESGAHAIERMSVRTSTTSIRIHWWDVWFEHSIIRNWLSLMQNPMFISIFIFVFESTDVVHTLEFSGFELNEKEPMPWQCKKTFFRSATENVFVTFQSFQCEVLLVECGTCLICLLWNGLCASTTPTSPDVSKCL